MTIIRVKYDAYYGRTGVIEPFAGRCKKCNQVKLCLKVDGSEGEYEPALICGECIKTILDAVYNTPDGEP